MHTMAVWCKPLFFLPLLFVSALSYTGYHPGAGIIASYDNPAVHDEKPTLITPTMTNKRNLTILTMPKVQNADTSFLGEWKVENQNTDTGVAAMHLQLMSTGKVVWFDTTSRAIEYNPTACTFQTIKVDNDPMSTIVASSQKYASQLTLGDDSFMVLGGRKAFTYELLPQKKIINLPFLKEPATSSLYPFLHLLPDGNVFVFANSKSIILEPRSGKVVRRLPELLGGSRNYPASGMSALLPIDLSAKTIKAEVMICGGNSHKALNFAKRGVFLPALSDCNRLVLTQPNAQWEKEEMPSPRVMGDMLILPNGDLLMINGAKKGCSSWESADEPNLTPVLYMPDKPKGHRMKELAPTKIARMYQSASTVLPNGQVLLAGSNPHQNYNFTSKFPTELRVEKFSPPYLDPKLTKAYIAKAATRSLELKYGQAFEEHVRIKVKTLFPSEIKLTLYAPPFTTNGVSMNQRLISLGLTSVSQDNIKAIAPASPNVAPPGHYLLFVVYRGVPSWSGRWVRLMA